MEKASLWASRGWGGKVSGTVSGIVIEFGKAVDDAR
jgi:hypothetical protein